MVPRLVLTVVLVAGVASGSEPAGKAGPPKVFTGQVVALAKSQGVALDTGQEQLLLAESVVSRKLFQDPQLQNRPVELTLREKPDTKQRDVLQIRLVKDGKRYEVFYFCHNCQLRAEDPGPCQCCGGDTVLVEKLVPPR